MPDYRQPNSLEGLSLGRVCQQIDGTCRRLQMLSLQSSVAHVLTLAKQSIRPYYVNSLSARLRSQIIEETSKMLRNTSPDGSTLISGPSPLYLLALLLSQDIKHLKVNLCCYYGCSHQTFLLKLLASEGSGLESLDLVRSALLRLDCKLFRSAVMNMRNLSKLTLRNIADDMVLQVIGRNCPRLVFLDVACSRQVTDAGLKQLLLQIELRDKVHHPAATQEHTSWSRIKRLLSLLKPRDSKSRRKERSVLLEYYERRNRLCDTLKVLNIANTCISSAGILLALMHLPQLESLAEYAHMGKVMEVMSRRSPIDTKTSFRLIQSRSCRSTLAQLELLAQCCPRIKKLHITEPRHSPEALRLFPYVSSLSLHDIPAETKWLDGFYDYLRTNGKGLHELNLRMAQSDVPLPMDLNEILSNCPNLRTIIHNGSHIVWTEDGPDPPPARHLTRVQLGHTVNASVIAKLLAVAPGLTVLHVYSCHDLTNDHLERMFKSAIDRRSTDRRRGLEDLTCFYIYKANRMSAKAALNVFNDYKRLRQIGNLTNWDLDCKEVGILRANLYDGNLDVELCSESHWFWSNCIPY